MTFYTRTNPLLTHCQALTKCGFHFVSFHSVFDVFPVVTDLPVFHSFQWFRIKHMNLSFTYKYKGWAFCVYVTTMRDYVTCSRYDIHNRLEKRKGMKRKRVCFDLVGISDKLRNKANSTIKQKEY